ncbi:pilus assembly protein [Streptomyces sp. AVP053U2]|uniref:pilus assembly protein n=1 Tax=Streptomyces sp. AVP053U2 TaxID=1737066 RepID=UPI00073BE965|nr:TadE-like protein [Streptomyces sp. AVP053U2]
MKGEEPCFCLGCDRDRDGDHDHDGERAGNQDRDRGQVTIEFLGMIPTILVTLVVLWQLVLLGYTFTLAGNAADEAVRAATAADPGARQGACEAAGLDKLPGAWEGAATVTCATGGGYVTADVTLGVPVLFPGTATFPFEVNGHAGAVEEEVGD